MANDSYETFDAVKTRLDEIVEAVSSEDLPLDDALALYEEAVALGLRASDLLETDIEDRRLQDEAAESGEEADATDASLEAIASEDGSVQESSPSPSEFQTGSADASETTTA